MLPIILFLAVIALYELYKDWRRNRDRTVYWNKAESRAASINRPLIVIGDPHNGTGSFYHGPAYGQGDMCVDIAGCRLNLCSKSVKADALTVLSKLPDNSHVIFISCVLEYVEDPGKMYEQILRVAGSRDNIFLLTVCEYTLTSRFLYTKDYHAKWIVYPDGRYKPA